MSVVRFGPYEIHRRTGEIRKFGLKVKLPGQPFEILAMLLERPGEIVTREELQQRLWPGDVFVDFEPSLNSAVKKLRRVLHDHPDKPRYIETLPRRGYRFIGQIEHDEPHQPGLAEEAAGIQALPAGLGPVSDSQVPGVRFWSYRGQALWLALLAISLSIVFYAVLRPGRTKPGARAPAPLAALPHRQSVAVIGFKNLSGRPQEAWLSIAFAQMLSTELAVGDTLRTIPEENVGRAKLELALADRDGYAPDTLNLIRKNLGSDYVVTGSYVALGAQTSGRVRLDLRLQDTVSGETLASVAVAGAKTEIFDLITQAGGELRAKLGAGKVSEEEAAGVRASLPSKPEAARLYAEGIAKLRVLDNLTARDLLARATALEPDYALAHSALASAWSALGYDAKALASAHRAFELSRNLPPTQRLAIEGRYHEMNRDWPQAIAIYRQLLQSHPDDLDHGLRLVHVQATSGNTKEALETLAALRQLSPPESDYLQIDLAEAAVAGMTSNYKREQALAEQAAAKGEARGARLLVARARLVQGWAFDDQGQFKESLTAYEAAQRTFSAAGDLDGMATAVNDIGIVLQKQGDLTGAKKKLAEALATFRKIGDENGVGAALTNLGEVYRVQGELGVAEQMYQQARVIFRKTERKDNEYVAMNNLGNVLYQRGDFTAAGKMFSDLLAAHHASANKSGIAIALTNLGDIRRVQGDLAPADQMYRESLALLGEIADQGSMAAVQLNLGKALLAQGNLPDARKILEGALTINQKIGAKGDAALDQIALAEVAVAEGATGGVDVTARQAAQELRQEERTDDAIEAEVMLARVLLAQGKTAEAAEALRPAVEAARKRGDWLVRFHVAVAQARVQAAQGQSSKATRGLEAALANAKEAGCGGCQLEARLLLGGIRMRSGGPQTGRTQLQAVADDARRKGFGLFARQAAALVQ